MQHSDADRTMASERYLLGEITGRELEDFEEHMFECVECAEAVRAGAGFTDNARDVFRAHPELVKADRREQKRGASSARTGFFSKWFSVPQFATSFAALALLFYAGHLRMEIAGLTEVRSLSAVLLAPPARGLEGPTEISANVSRFALQLDSLPKACESVGCTARIEDSNKRLIGKAFDLAVSSDRSAYIEGLTRAALPPGNYKVVVQTKSANGGETEDRAFRVMEKQ